MQKNLDLKWDAYPKYRQVYVLFITTKKQIKNDKYVTYNLKFIDRKRFMNDSLSYPVDILSGLYDCECLNKKDQDIKIKYKEQKVLIHKKYNRK